jgi:hypothetical protein
VCFILSQKMCHEKKSNKNKGKAFSSPCRQRKKFNMAFLSLEREKVLTHKSDVQCWTLNELTEGKSPSLGDNNEAIYKGKNES